MLIACQDYWSWWERSWPNPAWLSTPEHASRSWLVSSTSDEDGRMDSTSKTGWRLNG